MAILTDSLFSARRAAFRREASRRGGYSLDVYVSIKPSPTLWQNLLESFHS
ncbi:hypothetical protein [Nostoc sp.]|uniref:hypothetical protein n=1 Tax=Nostoc sp. TaxID=1180 RepID=UPI002FF635F3